MTVLHVREQGAVVRKDGEQIQVTQRDKTAKKQSLLAETPIRELTQVILYGNVQVTTQAVALLLDHKIDLVFMSLRGKFRGRLLDSGSTFARLRHAQLRLAGNEQASLAVATKIVEAKLTNQGQLLQAILATTTDTTRQAALATAVRGVAEMRHASIRAGSADELRGFEGKAGAFYFAAVGALLAPAWNFAGRKYYPAPDPFNALLSFGYALLLKDSTATLQVVGLDPYVGCFHTLEYNRPSLTLDLMEEFRPLVVDRIMLSLVLAGKIAPGSFQYTGREERPVELGDSLLPTVIEAYEQQMNTPVMHTASHTQVTLRRAMELQARMFARVVMHERGAYEGMIG